jgi:HSP20 family protein
MDLVQLDPFSMVRDIERMFERGPVGRSRWLPRIDAFDREKELVVRIELAGVDPADVDITVEDRTLTITGSRSLDESTEDNGFHRREIFSGEFRRSLVLPEGLDPTEISATADKGIIEVVIPRRPEVLPRKVKVDVAEGEK